jgi:hypothetical protein
MLRFARVAIIVVGLLGCVTSASGQVGASSTDERQSLDDAWWTGPMLAPSASTLPRGHILIEPYLYDVTAAHANGFGSLTYMNYGLTDRVTVGLIPTAGFNAVSNGASSSGIGMGDLSVQGQFRLTTFRPGNWVPTTSVAVQETFPTGKYDRLGQRPSDGMGSGVYTTTLSFYTQTYFWLPNGRILRTRFNVSHALPSRAEVRDVSVYGTAAGFRGHAEPGKSIVLDSSWEYSMTRRWVLAVEATYRHGSNTRVAGTNVFDSTNVRLNLGSSDTVAFAPAVEYSWKPNIGVLLGVRVIPPGHNTSPTITPAVALNFVH